jgi:hypothetical protein
MSECLKQQYDEIMERGRPKFYDMDTKLIDNPLDWARYCEERMRDGTKTLAHDYVGKYRISTVYVGLDMGMFNRFPLIFETMIFCEDEGDPLNLWMDRYTYKEQALAGHEIALKLARGEISLDDAGGV